jgi:hypothetical protein
MLVKRVATEKALPFEPLIPNGKPSRRRRRARAQRDDQRRSVGEAAHKPECGLLGTPAALPAITSVSNPGITGKRLDAMLFGTVNMLATDRPLPRRI